MTAKTPNELVKVPDAELSKDDLMLKKMYLNELEQQDTDTTSHIPQPQVIEVMHKKGLFSLPDKTAKDFDAVIIDATITRGYWKGTEAGDPLYCSSIGGQIGKATDEGKEHHGYLNDVAPVCEGCPFDAWGTGRNGKGKACKEMRTMICVHPDYSGALKLSCSPMSIKAFDKHWSKMKAARRLICGMITKMSLKVVGQKPQEYSQFIFEAGDDLDAATLADVLRVKSMYKGSVKDVGRDDYMGSAE